MEVTQEQRETQAQAVPEPSPASLAEPQPQEVEGVRISAPPRPIRQKLPADVFVAYDAGMRVRAADLYRLLQQGPVPIAPDYPQVVTWMRARGVRIKTRMSTEGSFYELESDVPVPS